MQKIQNLKPGIEPSWSRTPLTHRRVTLNPIWAQGSASEFHSGWKGSEMQPVCNLAKQGDATDLQINLIEAVLGLSLLTLLLPQLVGNLGGKPNAGNVPLSLHCHQL